MMLNHNLFYLYMQHKKKPAAYQQRTLFGIFLTNIRFDNAITDYIIALEKIFFHLLYFFEKTDYLYI